MNSLPQNGPFRGRFEVKLDPKGRLLLPSSYRDVLPGERLQLIATNGRYRGAGCLDVYSLAQWELLEKRIARLSSLKSEVQAFNRFYLSGGQPIEVDAQNRVLIPQGLRKYASLDLHGSSQVVLVGLNDKFEIWAGAAWTSIHEQLTESFEETMAKVAALEADLDESERER